MIYGLYLSATGVLTNSYRQDVIANNIANAETVGFKKDLATFMERPTEARARGLGPNASDPVLEGMGGGLFAAPTLIDTSQGDLEESRNNLDVAIQGTGYFTVQDHGQTRLTRDGRFMVGRDGTLIGQGGQQVLDPQGKPIELDPTAPANRNSIGRGGEVIQNGVYVGRIAVVDVPNAALLTKRGGGMMDYPDLGKSARPADSAIVRGGFTERANVESATELTQLMDAQRQLEANANMIRYQDQTLQRLCNDVGKIS